MEPTESQKKGLIASGQWKEEDFLPEEGTCPYDEEIHDKTTECDCSRYRRAQCRDDI